MAAANKSVEVVRTEVVTLTLSVEEAGTLLAVLAHVGGDRETSPRKHASAVYFALAEAGIAGSAESRLVTKGGRVGIEFRDYPGTATTRATERMWGSI